MKRLKVAWHINTRCSNELWQPFMWTHTELRFAVTNDSRPGNGIVPTLLHLNNIRWTIYFRIEISHLPPTWDGNFKLFCDPWHDNVNGAFPLSWSNKMWLKYFSYLWFQFEYWSRKLYSVFAGILFAVWWAGPGGIISFCLEQRVVCVCHCCFITPGSWQLATQRDEKVIAIANCY